MYTIIPLAGPDFHSERGVKPMLNVEGEPLVKRAITSRPWFKSGEQTTDKLIFVLRNTEHTQAFEKYIKDTFPGCKIATISHLTGGALMTALAGASLVHDFNEPVCVDLVDILYTVELDDSITGFFKKNSEYYGIIPCFEDNYDKYSYLQIKDNKVLRTAEKQVISNVASAGTYFFRDLPTLLEATAGSIENKDEYAYKGSLFMCPSYNELIRKGKEVAPLFVSNVVCLSRKFKE